MILAFLEILVIIGGVSVQRFSCKTRIVSGAGAVSYLKELGSKKLLLVSDPYFSQNGTARDLV